MVLFRNAHKELFIFLSVGLYTADFCFSPASVLSPFLTHLVSSPWFNILSVKIPMLLVYPLSFLTARDFLQIIVLICILSKFRCPQSSRQRSGSGHTSRSLPDTFWSKCAAQASGEHTRDLSPECFYGLWIFLKCLCVLFPC